MMRVSFIVCYVLLHLLSRPLRIAAQPASPKQKVLSYLNEILIVPDSLSPSQKFEERTIRLYRMDSSWLPDIRSRYLGCQNGISDVSLQLVLRNHKQLLSEPISIKCVADSETNSIARYNFRLTSASDSVQVHYTLEYFAYPTQEGWKTDWNFKPPFLAVEDTSYEETILEENVAIYQKKLASYKLSAWEVWKEYSQICHLIGTKAHPFDLIFIPDTEAGRFLGVSDTLTGESAYFLNTVLLTSPLSLRHELAHVAVQPLCPSPFLNEGFATFIGGEGGHPFKEVMNRLWSISESLDPLWRIERLWEDRSEYSYMVSGLICSVVARHRGMTGLRSLLKIPDPYAIRRYLVRTLRAKKGGLHKAMLRELKRAVSP